MTTPVIDTEHLGPSGDLSAGSTPASVFKEQEGPEITPNPMVPPEVDMTDEGVEALVSYLDEQITLATNERQPWLDKLARLKEKLAAPFPTEPKNWPIQNASQIIIPIIKIAVDATATRLSQTVLAAEPLATIRTEDKDDFIVSAAHNYEKFLDIYSAERLDMREKVDTWVLETVGLGTGITETTEFTDKRVMLVYNPDTQKYDQITKEIYNGPIFYNVPLEDWWIRPAYTEIAKAPWCGKSLRLTWGEIKGMAFAGELDPDQIDNIWQHKISLGDDGVVPKSVTDEEARADFEPSTRDQFRIFELAVQWDVAGLGVETELLVYYHHESRTLLRRKGGKLPRPWEKAVFKKIPHWFYGEGLAEMLEHLQEEISTTHNQRIDNSTMANLQIILVKSLIAGLRPGDRLWTGKIVKVQNVKEDVGTLRLGEIYPSTVANENIAMQYVERLSAIGAAATGTAQPVSRTTATAQMALLEELNRRFDRTLKSLRGGLKRSYDRINISFMERGTGGLAEQWLGAGPGQQVEEFLRIPRDVLARKFKIQVIATRGTVNTEVELNTQLQVWNLLLNMWQQIRAEAVQLSPQMLPVLAHEMVKALRPVFKRILQLADAPDPDEAISVLALLEQILPAPQDFGGLQGSQEAEQSALLQEALAGGGAGSPNGDGVGGVEAAQGVPGLGNTGRTAIPTNR